MQGISGVDEEPVPFQEGFHSMELRHRKWLLLHTTVSSKKRITHKKTTGLLGFRLFLGL
jgi:hypothetical protein